MNDTRMQCTSTNSTHLVCLFKLVLLNNLMKFIILMETQHVWHRSRKTSTAFNFRCSILSASRKKESQQLKKNRIHHTETRDTSTSTKIYMLAMASGCGENVKDQMSRSHEKKKKQKKRTWLSRCTHFCPQPLLSI